VEEAGEAEACEAPSARLACVVEAAEAEAEGVTEEKLEYSAGCLQTEASATSCSSQQAFSDAQLQPGLQLIEVAFYPRYLINYTALKDNTYII
jgi:hypothetical protein